MLINVSGSLRKQSRYAAAYKETMQQAEANKFKVNFCRMVLRKIFPIIYPEPDSAPAKSRNAPLNLLRGIYIIGIRSPPKNFFLLYCLWSFIFNLSSTFYQPVAFFLGYIGHLSEYSASEFFASLQVVFNAWACSAKVLIVWVLVKRFDQATLIMDEMDKRLTKPSERHKIHQSVALSNRIFFVFVAMYMGYVTINFLGSVYVGVPPYQNYYPGLDWRASKYHFWLQAGLEYFAMLGASFQNVCVDIYPINFVLPLRAHMANFADRLRQLGQDPDEKPEQSYNKLVQCIEDHKVILRFCDTIRPIISGTIFVQLLVVGLVLGLTMITITISESFAGRLAALIYFCALFLETTPFCILCNYLTDDCSKLADALFESNWIDKERPYKKTMLQFLQKLQKPIVFMAGNVLNISVATNINATKVAFSVFTVVKQMNIVDNLGKSS